MFGLRKNKRPAENYAAMVVRLQEHLTPGDPWTQHRPNYWSAIVTTAWEGTGFADQEFSLILGVPSEETLGAFTEALITWEVAPEARKEVVSFCAAANARFNFCNLSLRAYDDGEFVVSSGLFRARESGVTLPAVLIETMVWRAVRSAVIATPAVRDLSNGATAAETLTVAASVPLTIDGHREARAEEPLNPKTLIDEALAALATLPPGQLPPLNRTSPTRFEASWGDEGSGRGFVVEASGSTVQAVCHPTEPVPEQQRGPMAEFLNLIAGSGVENALGLDPDTGVLSCSNSANFAGTEPPRESLLRDLLLDVLFGPDRYIRAMYDVWFGELDPVAAFAQISETLQARTY